MEILEWNGFVVVKVNNGGIRKENGQFIPPRRKGVSDILACSPAGRFWAIEVKRPDGVTSPEQERFIEDVKSKGGIGFVVRSVDEMTSIIENHKKFGLNIKT